VKLASYYAILARISDAETNQQQAVELLIKANATNRFAKPYYLRQLSRNEDLADIVQLPEIQEMLDSSPGND
jgi:hypothetical protein